MVGGAIHHDLSLIDSSDEDAPFVVPARPSLGGVGPRVRWAIQDRDWHRGGVETPNTQVTTRHTPDELYTAATLHGLARAS